MNHDDMSFGAPEPLSTEEAAELANVQPVIDLLRQWPEDQSARIAELEGAIDDALVSAHIGTLESFPNPRAAIHALEAWNATVALDPAVSQDAAKLHERTAELERQRDALLEALKMAVLQNEHDMLMTGEELRRCESAIKAAGGGK